MIAGACKICGNANLSPHLKPHTDFNLFACNNCGLVELATSDEASSYVAEMEDEFFSEQFIESHDWFQRWLSRKQTSRRIRDVLKFRAAGDLLEIGPGAGEFLRTVKRYGFRAYGLEMSEPLAAYVGKATGAEVRIGSFEDIPSLGQTFDVVMMSHVLEHVDDPVASLKHILPAISPDSIIYLAVPNISSWTARLGGWKPYLPYHLTYFNPQTLRKAVEAAGFEVVMESTYQDGPAWPVAVARTLLKRLRPLRSLPSTNGNRTKKKQPKLFLDTWNFLTLAIGLCLTPMCWIQSKVMQGDELVIVARPRQR